MLAVMQFRIFLFPSPVASLESGAFGESALEELNIAWD
jgi:hypothetical protein